MKTSRRILFAFLIAAMPGMLGAAPVITLVAGVGDSVPTNYYSDTTLLSVAGPPAIDAAGDVAFRARVQGRYIVKGADAGILLYSGTECISVASLGGADPITGGTFEKLSDPVMSGSGAIAFVGTLKTSGTITTKNNTGVYVFKNGQLSLVGQTSGKVDGLDGATFARFINIGVNDAGGVAMLAVLMGTTNTPALFGTGTPGTLQLLAHKRGMFAINGVNETVRDVTAFAPLPFVGGQSRTLDVAGGNVATLIEGDGGKAAVSLAHSGSNGFDAGTLVTTSGTISSLPGVTIKSLDEPAVNSAGEVAFSCVLTGSGIEATNDSGIAVLGGSAGGEIVRIGDPAADATGLATSGTFTKLSDPVLNNNGRIAFIGTLETNGASISAGNDIGIWSDWDGTMKRIVCEGDPAPGGTAGTFSAFKQLVLPDVGGPIFVATLSGVPAAQNMGVWAIAPGETLTPVVTTGGTTSQLDFHGVPETVKSFTIFPLAPDVMGQSRSFDASTGNMVFEANFFDGLWGIYEVSFP